MASRTRSAKALGVDATLRTAAAELLEADVNVTARMLARRAGLGAASSITRDPVRRRLLEDAKEEQQIRRGWVERSRKEPPARLRAALAARDAELARRRQQVQLLTASHKAMLLAVDEMGGTRAWVQFFASYSSGLGDLQQMGALPSEVSIPALPPPRDLPRGRPKK